MKELETHNPVTEPANLLTSLLGEVPHVQAFKTKWAIIGTKLAQLEAQLTSLSELHTSASHPLSLDLLSSITVTLTDAVSLSDKCKSADLLSHGKLRAQSDVDSVVARLDEHVRDSEVLNKSGILRNDAVLFSNKKETVLAEIKSLITRLQIGAPESKNAALDSLLIILQEDDKNVSVAVDEGVVPVMIRYLDLCTDPKGREKVVWTVSRVVEVESGRHALVAEGVWVLNQLVRALESGTGLAKEKACLVLQGLSFCKENARAIGSRGGICSLLEICRSGTPGSMAYAAGVVRNLAGFSEVRENLVEENAVFVMVRLLGIGTVLAQENAVGCLCNLVKDDDGMRVLVVKEGVVDLLRNFWDSDPPLKCLEVVLELLGELGVNQVVGEMLVDDGWVGRVLGVLSCGVSGVRIAAARVVYEIGFYSPKTRKEMGEFGCVGQLVKMLDGKAAEEREAAVRALSVMVVCAGNQRLFRKDERGMVSTVQLLDPSLQGLDKRYPVLVLSELLHSRKCRKEMVAAGACLHLKKLVEMEVDGAKKLLDGLGKGKIWGVFARP